MTIPIIPRPATKRPETPGSTTTGEGAKSALAEMIRKRQMAENRVDHETEEQLAKKAVPDA